MEWGRIKNIILLLLVLVNAFLLILVAARWDQARRYRQSALEDTVAVFRQNGISLSRDQIPEDAQAPTLYIERDPAQELKIARLLLGEVRIEEPGGGISFYSGDDGSAEFRSNGEFSVSLARGILPLAADPEAQARELLSQMGIETAPGPLTFVEADGMLQLTVRQRVGELPVFSCEISFLWDQTGLRAVSGRRLHGTPLPRGESAPLLSATTALVRFWDEMNRAGDICTEITQVTLGYRIPSASLGDLLTPVWLVATDTGVYYIDGLSGAVGTRE